MSWNVTVLGAGAWGTAMALLIAKKGHRVRLWENFPLLCQKMQKDKENKSYLPGVSMDVPGLELSADLEDSVRSSDLLILAIPSKHLESFLPRLAPFLSSSHHMLSLVKGILPRPVPRLLHEDLLEGLPALSIERFATLSGPNFAREIALELPAATVIAGSSSGFLNDLQLFLSNAIFRVYTNHDLIGVQLGGIMKNVIAVAAGILDGCSMGYNAKSSLIVRGISEMGQLFVAMGGQQETLFGLSGLGDLIGTCTSPLSRNWWAGTQLAEGVGYESMQKNTRTTVEGIDSLPGILRLAQMKNLELPISQEIHAIVFDGKNIHQSLQDLMSRKLRAES